MPSPLDFPLTTLRAKYYRCNSISQRHRRLVSHPVRDTQHLWAHWTAEAERYEAMAAQYRAAIAILEATCQK